MAQPAAGQMMGGNGMLPNGAPILRGAAAAQGSQYAGGSSQMMAGVPPGTMIPTQGVGSMMPEAATAAAPKGRAKAPPKGKKLTKAQQAAQAKQLAQQQQMAQQQQAAMRGRQQPGSGGGGVVANWRDINDEQLRKAYIVKQQRWLLFLRHASKCQARHGHCPYTPHCHVAKQLWEHVLKCTLTQCNYPRCLASRELLKHHQTCKDAGCPVCGPVRNAMLKQRQQAQMQMAHGNKRMKLDHDLDRGQLMVKGTSGLKTDRKPGG